MRIDHFLKQNLQKEIPILRAEIQTLYQELDRKFGLHGAEVRITFGYEEDVLGSYKQGTLDEPEQFHFSLLYVGYCVRNPLSREDRMDLFKHEYAHYMQYHFEIPSKYQWQPGIHGSAWKYCCSLVGAAPTPYYKVGESLMEHNYEKALNHPLKDNYIPVRDQYRSEQEYRKRKNSEVRYRENDIVQHPKYGEGIVEAITVGPASVRLKVRFGDVLKIIDQNWLLRAQHTRSGNGVGK